LVLRQRGRGDHGEPRQPDAKTANSGESFIHGFQMGIPGAFTLNGFAISGRQNLNQNAKNAIDTFV
jgi:hypothetical protein